MSVRGSKALVPSVILSSWSAVLSGQTDVPACLSTVDYEEFAWMI